MMTALRASKNTSDVGDDDSIACPKCGGRIEVHQPDPDLPRRLLATCDDCKEWFLTGPTRSWFRRLKGEPRQPGRDPGVN